MIQFTHCKINLGLSILEKRTDGYHELETVFYPIALQDIVEILPAKHSAAQITFTHTGIPVPGSTENNLCIKAYYLLKKDFPLLPSIQMHLHKNVPMGAGLGGGSSDGTAVLKMLNQQFGLLLNKQQLVDYAAQLGSDCPFFVYDQACHAIGRGEKLSPFNCDLSAYQIILLHPRIPISTAWAFGQLHPHKKLKTIATIVAQPIETWKSELINDFEDSIFEAHPLLSDLKKYCYQQGAIYASMSGSGSSIYGLFPKGTHLEKPAFYNALRIDMI